MLILLSPVRQYIIVAMIILSNANHVIAAIIPMSCYCLIVPISRYRPERQYIIVAPDGNLVTDNVIAAIT